MSNNSKTFSLLTSATDPYSSMPIVINTHRQKQGTLYLPLGDQNGFDKAVRAHLLRDGPAFEDYTCCGFTYSRPDAVFFFKHNSKTSNEPGAWRLSSHGIWTDMGQTDSGGIPPWCAFGETDLEAAVLQSYSSGDSTFKVSQLSLRDWLPKMTVIEPQRTLISEITDAANGSEGAVFAVGSGEGAEWEVFRFVEDASLIT